MAARRSTQLTFFGDSNSKDQFGGDIKGKRKIKRPVATKRPMHITMRSERARGTFSMLTRRNPAKVSAIVSLNARCYRVKVFEWVNVGNHIHLLVQAQSREGFANFLRRVTCEIALAVTGARKGNRFGKFWTGLAFSRIVPWGRGFDTVKRYLELNRLEAAGIPRRHGMQLLQARSEKVFCSTLKAGP